MYREGNREFPSARRPSPSYTPHPGQRPSRGRFKFRYLIFIMLAVLTVGVIIIVKVGSSHTASAASGNGVQASTNSPIIGMADNSLLGRPAENQAAQLSAMKAIGITSLRVDANWRLIQPTGPTEFEWSSLDKEIQSIKSAGMSVDLIIDGCPSWAGIAGTRKDMFAQPKSSTQFATWAAEVAARYSKMGVRYFEIWNEPNITEFWRPRPDPAAYTADLIAAYASIKKADPAAVVISGGLAPASNNGVNFTPVTFVNDMYLNGAKGSFDYLAVHPYSYPSLPDTYDPGSAWSEMDETNPSVRSIMAANGDSSKKIWITEFGEPTTGRPGVSPATESETLTQALAYARKEDWIGAFYIYTWRDSSATPNHSNSFGIETFNGTPKPAFYALSAALHPKH